MKNYKIENTVYKYTGQKKSESNNTANFRTDLAIESVSEFGMEQKNIGFKVSEREENNILITNIEIDKEAEEKLNKKAGKYITLDLQKIDINDHDELEKLRISLASEIEKLIVEKGISELNRGLIVGLGNMNITPDALGPLVAEKVMVTNHIFNIDPASMEEGFRPVASIAPGVMGTTGIETYEIVDSVVKRIKPSFVIVIDALASRAIERVNKTIQISDYGINPGSGVGNNRKSISRETLGIPVISIGVPTVVDATTIVKDSLDYMLKYITHSATNESPKDKLVTIATNKVDASEIKKTEIDSSEMREKLLGHVGTLSDGELRQLVAEILTPLGLNMIVTPKEIDDDVEHLANIIGRGINIALHEKINE